MLDDIGFYTMTEERVRGLSDTSPMWRCEVEITSRCNFRCPYCRGLQAKGDLALNDVLDLIDLWMPKNIRFSGGEPTMHRHLLDMVKYAAKYGRVAVSTNGSQPWKRYRELIDGGVTDFSVSLDACCSQTADKMAGIAGAYKTILDNIRRMAKEVYVTIGTVITEDNLNEVRDTILLAHNLGVADIRPIPAAQYGAALAKINLPQSVLDAHPILRYRMENAVMEEPVRGLRRTDSHKCWLVTDDSCVAGDKHYPCVIYMREQGKPIGEVGLHMREDRIAWRDNHDTHGDPICSGNCLDVCREFNNAADGR
jgi:molybdenum cofactor biosynthesis enzyme MoaA